MINHKEDKVIEKLFQSLLSKYQIGLEISMTGGDFSLIVLICCNKNVMKQIFNLVDHI